MVGRCLQEPYPWLPSRSEYVGTLGQQKNQWSVDIHQQGAKIRLRL